MFISITRLLTNRKVAETLWIKQLTIQVTGISKEQPESVIILILETNPKLGKPFLSAEYNVSYLSPPVDKCLQAHSSS